MRVVILTVGTHGDVRPCVALGRGLVGAGHEVRIATHAEYEPFVREWGLDFAAVEGNPQAVFQGEIGRRLAASSRPGLAFLRYGKRLLRPLVRTFLEDCWRASREAEAIVYTRTAFAGWQIAEKLRAPCAAVHYRPHTVGPFLQRVFPSGPLGLGRALNHFNFHFGQQVAWQFVRPMVNRWRRETLDLPPLPFTGGARRVYRRQVPFLFAYSPAVIPKPPSWPAWYDVTGYWFLDRPEGWQPPPELLAFLADGPPPIYLGFGSMTFEDPAATTELALEALRRTGRRGIIQAGWAGLGRSDLPDDVFLIDDVPHDWLFPRVAAVVHHGGAGTTGSGLRAGVPSIIVPVFFDQPFWARRVAALGVGPPPVPQRALSADWLSASIRAAERDDVRDRAAALGERIRAEDGVARALRTLQAPIPAVA